MSAPALELNNVSVRFGERTVLENLQLTLAEHEFLGVIGPNGAGKTVLLKTIVGLIPEWEGSIRVFGKDVRRKRGLTGYVPQFARFDIDFPITALDVTLAGRFSQETVFGRFGKASREKAMHALELVEMADAASERIGSLSGGQVQRVLIARALVGEPKLLLLDEPTASVDTRMGKSVFELLHSLAEKLTIVMVSHDIGVISQYVTSIACLNRTLHYHGSKELDAEAVEAAYGCPVDLLAHGHPHRVLATHECSHAQAERSEGED